MKLYSDMLIGKQPRNKTIQKERVLHYGLDTETLFGKCHLLTFSGMDKHGFLYLSIEEDTKGILDILQFLTQKKFEKSLNWFYNLDYDIRAVLRWCKEEDIRKLYEEKEVLIGDYHITYLPKKFFVIRKGNKKYSYYDVSQFYPGGLDKNALKYLGVGKDKKIDSKVLGSSPDYWRENHIDIIKYCIQDSEITGRLGKLFYSNLWKVLAFNPKNPYSAGSISQEYFINYCDFIPTISGIPTGILKIHQDNFRGGRIEILKRGFFKDVYSFDIKSAYPSEMINLLDYSNGNWVRSKDYDDKYHGIYLVKFSWFNDYMGFIAFNHDGRTIYPNVDNGLSWINEKELCLLSNYSMDYEVLDGYTFIPYQEKYPYRDIILNLYDLKEGAKDDNERMLYKLFINSIYGKTAQAIYDGSIRKYKTGKLYNPLYSCRITANTRLKVLEHALPISKDVIGFSTDSIQSLSNNVKCCNALGSFDFEYKASEGVILMAGVRYLDDYQKIRGFTKKDKDGNEIILKKILQNNLSENKIPIWIEKPVTVFQGLNYKKLNYTDINIFQEEKRYLDINGDNRRWWFDDFSNCKDVFSRNIDSSPIFLEDIANP